jgi:two-component system nitrate/nitrite response regulator NarL
LSPVRATPPAGGGTRGRPREDSGQQALGIVRIVAALESSVLVIEDDAMVRGWVRLSLEGTEFRLAGEASSAATVLELVQRRSPEALLVDYRLPDGTGFDLVRALRQSDVPAPALLMSANPERGFNEAAREAGAQGSILKTGSREELLGALRLLVSGDEAFDYRFPRRDPGRAALSPREREVLRAVAAGATNPEIARQLGVGPETVKTLLARTFAKLGVRRRAEAVAAAHRDGLL